MKHIWTVICQNSSIDKETNLLSMFDCIEELSLEINKIKSSKSNLSIPIKFDIVSFWIIENPEKENTLEIAIEILDPNKKLLHRLENKFDVKKGALRFRNRIHMQGLPITEAGRYIIKIMQKNKKDLKTVTELPLDVKISYKIDLSNIKN